MFVIRVDDGNGSREVETSPWTVRQWELHQKLRLSQLGQRGFGMDDYMFLAWRELTDQGEISATFDKWARSLKVCEIVYRSSDDGETDENADPNSPSPSEALDD